MESVSVWVSSSKVYLRVIGGEFSDHTTCSKINWTRKNAEYEAFKKKLCTYIDKKSPLVIPYDTSHLIGDLLRDHEAIPVHITHHRNSMHVEILEKPGITTFKRKESRVADLSFFLLETLPLKLPHYTT